ncbi:Sialate O-acetylesterase (H-Lse) (Sialic acid-specific 9-O-acetylesterase) [Durusdinium trenchii]|uniref:Sialate O-acetylesterase (H-Lse) (Sialic acid-specific 9-O-acetylesterase) n=1 Tax=Durusdinium trenchii TaxID=1381693 RepID=A0ABP0PKE3_9DINO
MVLMHWLLWSASLLGAAALRFAEVFGDYVVLQQQPAKAAIFGEVNDTSVSTVTVELSAGSKKVASVEANVLGGTWKALLPPQAAGGQWSITARAGTKSVEMNSVTFGDVWYCSGQSNMALPLIHTMSRNISVDAIKAGKYANIRIHGMSGNMNPTQPWQKVSDAIQSPGSCEKGDCAFFKYSSTCWYFAESLSDRLNDDTPIGLIHTAWGGSMIEAWLDNKTIATCKNASISAGNQKYHDERVMPYSNMTLKGWIWYQGENDMHGVHGNSALNYGYGCLAQRLVDSWRQIWSTEAETTNPMAPFGFVTLAPSGGEGGNSMGAMRWAQTANYGVAPNPAMPKTFMAQAFDLDDPFSNITCYRAGCCGTATPKPQCHSCFGPNGYCANLSATNYYMGPIHPRDKKPVGDRLAAAAASIAYGLQGPFTGPTLAGCQMANGKITVQFNRSLLGSDRLIVQDYKTLGSSRVEVLTNKSLFCLQTSGRKDEECIDDGSGKGAGTGAFEDEKTWVSVDVHQAWPKTTRESCDFPQPYEVSANSIVVDLAKTQGMAFGIRYAWKGDCCDQRPATGAACPVASCPLMAQHSGLPANPFIAHIENGRCKCVAPQVCDENLEMESPKRKKNLGRHGPQI